MVNLYKKYLASGFVSVGLVKMPVGSKVAITFSASPSGSSPKNYFLLFFLSIINYNSGNKV